MWMSLFAAALPISTFGCTKEVIFTGEYSEMLESSNPMTSTSSGTRTLCFCKRSITPYAIWSYDQIAYGVIDLLQKHNVRVPEDVLVIGFDDSSISEYSPVKITSFVHPKVEMGRAAANKLIHMLRSSDPEQPLVLDMPLHEKESTRR